MKKQSKFLLVNIYLIEHTLASIQWVDCTHQWSDENSCKANRWCNNHSHKYFMGKNYRKLHRLSDRHSTIYAIIHQLLNHHNSQYINYYCKKKILLFCVYLIVVYIFCIKLSFSNLPLFHFQTKDSDTHMYVHS